MLFLGGRGMGGEGICCLGTVRIRHAQRASLAVTLLVGVRQT